MQPLSEDIRNKCNLQTQIAHVWKTKDRSYYRPNVSEIETNIFYGSPSLSKLAGEKSCGGSLESEPREVYSTDISDCIVFFINEATLCRES
jgi:hypothetical protein